MLNKKNAAKGDTTIPLQIRVGGDARAKMILIAKKNGLSLNDVASLCLAAGLVKVETKLDEMREPEPAEAA